MNLNRSENFLDHLNNRERLSYTSTSIFSLESTYLLEKFHSPKKLRGHFGCVNSVLFSHGGEMIITGSDDCFINIYDIHGEIVDHIESMHTNNICK